MEQPRKYKISAIGIVLALLVLLLAGCAGAAREQKPILLQGQRGWETETLIDALEKPTQENVGGITYHKGTIDGYPVIVVDHSVGIANTAGATAAAIMKYEPYCVINQGTSGGHDPALNRYDIVLGEKNVYINFIYTQPREEGEGMDAADWNLNYYLFKTDVIQDPVGALDVETGGGSNETGKIKLEYVPSDPRLLELAESVSSTYTKGNVVRGVIGSGDAWNREVDRIKAIHQQFGTSCEEMESFAAAYICQYHEVPFLGVRIISNSEVAGEENREFKRESGYDLQDYVLTITKAIIADAKTK